MRKLTVLLTGSKKIVYFQESIVTERSYILLKKAYIIWEYYNVTAAKGNTYTFNKGTELLDDGYYTFYDFKKVLEKNKGITLTLDKPTAKCIVTLEGSTTTLVLHDNIVSLLGLPTDKYSEGFITGRGRVNVNNGLKWVIITLDIINESVNLYNGKRSNVLTSLPIPTNQSLFGSTQSFFDIESELEIDAGVINKLEFNVIDQNGKRLDNYGSILLELYIR